MPLKAPHVAAVQDISGMGRCSLTVILPVLSAMGCWCSPLLTAYLSASTIYPPSDRFVITDMTGELEGSMAHWQELNPRFDAYYSGFVGSEQQIGLIMDFFARGKAQGGLVMVDPVMGDGGRTYRTYTPAMCRAMTELAGLADLITPNLTEAAILLGESYDCAPQTEGELRSWLERLSLGRRRSVVITGVHPTLRDVGAACYDRDTGEFSFPATREEPARFPGTGDLFASVLLGGLLRGDSLAQAVSLAVRFVGDCARLTLELGTPIPEGVQFETLLGELIPGPHPGPSSR